MLHYKIMSYESDYDWGQLVDMTSLRDKNSIEREFVKRLNDNLNDEPFADELSAKLMAELDNSRRTGDYAVITPKGRGCITCLGTGIKFGLMVIDLAARGKSAITKPYAAGMDVLEWLSRHGEYTLVLTDNECDRSVKEVLTLVNNGAADLDYMGQTYSAYGLRDCMTALAPLIAKNEGSVEDDTF